jgi:hypothetical protein
MEDNSSFLDLYTAKSVLLYERGFSPYYDIVWSFDYYLDKITPETEFGFVFFLQDNSIVPRSQSFGINLGYTNNNESLDIITRPNGDLFRRPDQTSIFSLRYEDGGLSGAVLGVGFDSTGCFALSTTYSGFILRDGKSEDQRIPNSVSIRGPSPAYGDRTFYSYNMYSVNYALTNFSIVDGVKKTMRARLGNLGRTIYIDYRRSPLEQYTNILTQNVTLGIPGSAFLRPGVIFTKPISSTSISAVPVSYIQNFHVEGKAYQPVFDFGSEVVPLTTLDIKAATTIIPNDIGVSEIPFEPVFISPPKEIFAPAYITDQTDTATLSVNFVKGVLSGFDVSGSVTDDIFNFGYKLSVIGLNEILYRTNYFEYKSLDNTHTLSLSSFNNKWILMSTNSPVAYIKELNTIPIGEYTSNINSNNKYNIIYL